jgi:polyhydroxybutyrate depolymerase
MKLITLIFLCLPVSLSGQITIDETFTFDSEEINYRLFIPPSYDSDNPVPLVISLHGFGGNGPGQQAYDKMSLVADTAGFIIAYPTAYNNTWNAGEDYYGPYTSFDDVGCISALIDSINIDYSIDLTRVYAMGMSNGGDMTYRLACELSDRIAAVASVTGTMITDIYESCDPSFPMPIIHYHGTADAISNIGGGAGWESLRNTMMLWRSLNGCSTIGGFPVPNTDTGDNTRAKIFRSDCGDLNMDYVIIRNGGHTWPGTPYNAWTIWSFGYTSGDIKGSEEIWRFFKEHIRLSPATEG